MYVYTPCTHMPGAFGSQGIRRSDHLKLGVTDSCELPGVLETKVMYSWRAGNDRNHWATWTISLQPQKTKSLSDSDCDDSRLKQDDADNQAVLQVWILESSEDGCSSWTGKNQTRSMILAKEASVTCPQIVIAFYLKKTNFACLSRRWRSEKYYYIKKLHSNEKLVMHGQVGIVCFFCCCCSINSTSYWLFETSSHFL